MDAKFKGFTVWEDIDWKCIEATYPVNDMVIVEKAVYINEYDSPLISHQI